MPVLQRLQETSATTLARQIAIAAIPAPTGSEGLRADAVAAQFARSGRPRVRRDAVGNVIATFPGARSHGATCAQTSAHTWRSAPVVVMAHLDTVLAPPPRVSVRYEGPRVYAAGIGDNGRGLAALLALGDVLPMADVARWHNHDIELVATVGEEGEGNLRGARHYFEERERQQAPRPVAMIALDGPGDSLIVHHAIASRRVRFSYAGTGGHPWADRGAPNAVHAVGLAVGAIAQLALVQPGGVSVAVTRVSGGESLTSVPMHGWLDVDIRALDPLALTRACDAVHRLAERARVDASRAAIMHESDACRHEPLRLFAEVLGDRPGGALDTLHPLVRLAADATTWVGAQPRSASASSDANIPLSMGIPAISLGAGGTGGGVHTAEEWYDDTNGHVGIARALAVVLGVGALP